MLPADRVQGTPRIGHVDGLVADGAEITNRIAREDLEALLGSEVSRKPRRRRVGRRLVPVVHGGGKRADRLRLRGYRFRVDSPHRPVAFTHIVGLGLFEMVDSPEKGKPAIGFGRGLGNQMSGVHHEHCVELKSNRGTRLDVADAHQKKRGEAFAVAKTLPDPGANLFQEVRARRVLEQTHERLDRRIEPNDPGIDLGLRG